MSDLPTTISAIDRVSPLATVDEVAAALGAYQGLKEFTKRLGEELNEGMLAWVRANGGRAVVGRTEYRIGTPAENKCRDVRAALLALLEACGGDVDTLAGCLSANALKAGACRAVLGDAWGEHFEVVRKPKLVGMEVKPQLIELNLEHAKGRRP